MNIWDHSQLSKRKFGGKEMDYYELHKFIDSSKLFYFNARHRLLLHNLYGIELVVQKFGDLLKNSDGKLILTRDLAAEHCKEDLSGKVPSLNQWLEGNQLPLANEIQIPEFDNKDLEAFVLRPYHRSNLKSALMITLSNFGVYLVQEILGLAASKQLQQKLVNPIPIEQHLAHFQFTANWQFTPSRKELEWLATINNNKSTKNES